MSPQAYSVFAFVWCYLLGSIPMGYVLMKFGKDIDIRTKGSGNIGMTNVWRVAGPRWGVATLLLDIGKGVAAVVVSKAYYGFDWIVGIGCAGVILGNLFPVYLRFKGGKGVGTSVGVFFTLAPVESLLGAGVFALALAWKRMVSVASLSAVTAFSLFMGHAHGATHPGTRLSMIVCLLVWWSHRGNLQRILAGTENTIDKGKSRKGSAA